MLDIICCRFVVVMVTVHVMAGDSGEVGASLLSDG